MSDTKKPDCNLPAPVKKYGICLAESEKMATISLQKAVQANLTLAKSTSYLLYKLIHKFTLTTGKKIVQNTTKYIRETYLSTMQDTFGSNIKINLNTTKYIELPDYLKALPEHKKPNSEPNPKTNSVQQSTIELQQNQDFQHK